jgi:type I restriction enzyme, S subunit
LGIWRKARGGIKKLRDLILQLAVQGKLVEQDAKDEPGEVLLKKIEVERKKLAKAGKIKKPKLVPMVSSAETRLALPNNWVWIRLGNIGSIFNCDSINASEKKREYTKKIQGYNYIATKDVDFVSRKINYENGIKIPFDNKGFKVAHKGAVLICAEGGSAGKKIAITEEDICFGNKLYATETFSGLLPHYLCYVYQSPYFYQEFSSTTTGIIGGTSINKFNQIPVPIPPLAEQKRIVAKVDELMALCDKLEAEQQTQRTLKTQAVQSTLHHLTTPESPASFSTGLNILERNFGNWFDDLTTVKHLRATILQLAVQGKLVSQDPNDEPASELIKRIEAEKKRLMKEGKIKFGKPLALLDESNKPYTIPSNWKWLRFGILLEHSEAGWSPKCENFPRTNNNWGVLKVSAVSWDKFKPEENKALPTNLEPRSKYEVILGDMLISRANTAELVARSVVVEDCPPRLMMSDKIIRLKITRLVDLRFCNLVNVSRVSRAYYANVAGGTSASMKNVSREQILSLAFPLPPIAEQKRIVAKVDALMTLCDQLEVNITTSQSKNSQLIDALMYKLLQKPEVASQYSDQEKRQCA